MINFIRAILKAITGTTNRFFTADGRPDEVVNGKMYQHYGFRSMPPAGCEMMTMQYGNNTVSVAENDGNLPETESITLQDKDVVLYNNQSYILLSDTMGLVILAKKGMAFETHGTTTIQFVADTGDVNIFTNGSNVLLGAPTGHKTLANKTFVDAVGVALTALGKTGFDPATIATGIYNTSITKAT